MNATPRRLLAALALTSALATAGCATMSDMQTDHPYQPADGINLNLGQGLDARGLLVIGGKDKGGPGRLTGQLVNTTNSPVTITFATADGSSVEAEIPAHASRNLADDELTLKAVPAVAGDLVAVTIKTPSAGTNVAQVPVLLPEGDYAKYAPAS